MPAVVCAEPSAIFEAIVSTEPTAQRPAYLGAFEPTVIAAHGTTNSAAVCGTFYTAIGST